MARTGIYPGTFDPITIGHMDIIRRALHIVDKLVIAVALDTGKTPVFELEERATLVRHELENLPEADRVRCEVTTFSGLLMHFAEAEGASVIIRGLRAISDFEYEVQMACLNRKLNDNIETIFLAASENTQFISSRFVKQIAKLGGDISSFVSPNVQKHLEAIYNL